MSSQDRFTKQQLAIIDYMYLYRFVTTKQIQKLLQKSHVQQAQQRLNTLLDKEYIGRRYSSDDRLLGRYASYFLLPKGLELLKGNGDKKALRLMKKDPTASQRFIDHCIAVGDVVSELKRLYDHEECVLSFLTKTGMMHHNTALWDGSEDFEYVLDYFPEPLPDVYLEGYEIPSCFVEVWHETVPFWVYRKRLQYLLDYMHDDIWQDYFGGDVPPFLLVCDTPTHQRRVQRYLRRVYDNTYEEDVFLVTNRLVLAETVTDDGIWIRVDDEATKSLRLTDVPDWFRSKRYGETQERE